MERVYATGELQKHPRRQCPGLHPTAPSCIDAALDQRGNRKAERHRKANILAKVEKRRMEGQTGVLQKRVQILPVKRWQARSSPW
jgi:hypothetical protein